MDLGERTARRARRAAGTAAVAAALALSGCSGGGEAKADPTPSGPAAPSMASSSPAGASESPSVAPATGVLMRFQRVSVRAPQGWTAGDRTFSTMIKAANDPKTFSQVNVSAMPALDPDSSLEESAKAVVQTGGFAPHPAILDPVTVDGVPCFHVRGMVGGERVEQFGAVHDGDLVQITFTFERATKPAEQQATVGAVLASVRWS